MTGNGAVPYREPGRAPQGLYPCRGDGWVAISVGSDKEWTAVCDAIGRPDLSDDERYAGVVARARHHDEIDALIAAWSTDLDADEVVRQLQARGVPAGVLAARSP